MRGFRDVKAARQAIYDKLYDTASTLDPIGNQRHTLLLKNVEWVDPDEYSKAERKNAVLTGATLGRRLRGTWQLHDNALGKVIEEKRATLFKVPYLTDSGTFIHGGNEYAVRSQQRLRSGVFVRRKENGEIEAHLNILANGPSHRYFLDPEKGVFFAKIGQSLLPLLPLLQAMGAKEPELRKAWGDDLYALNFQKADPSVLGKFAERILRKDDGRPHNVQLREAFERMTLDPEVTGRTLGHPHSTLTKDAMLDATTKLLKVSRREADIDDRDHLAYQNFVGPEDLFAERLRKDRGGMRRTLLFRTSGKGNLSSIGASALQDQIDSAITESGLGVPLEEINPAEVLDKLSQLTRMGEGGIPCHVEETEVFTATGWKPWPAVTATDQLGICVDGALLFEEPLALHVAEFYGDVYVADTRGVAYAVTADHRMWVSTPTTRADVPCWRDFRFVTAADVHQKEVRHIAAVGAFVGGNKPPSTFTILPADTGGNNGSAITSPVVVAFRDWVQFLGYYLADGSTTFAPRRKEYRVEIAKRRSVNPQEADMIEAVLQRLGFTHRYEQDRRFIVSGKHIAALMRQFGKAGRKYVPEYIMSADHATRALFFDAITAMDGRQGSVGCFVYESASVRLVNQVEWLAISLGRATTRRKLSKEGYSGIGILTDTIRGITPQRDRSEYRTECYRGRVYCATVRGGMLLTRYRGRSLWSGNSYDSIPDESRSVQPSQAGFVDPLRTPESERAGVDVFVGSRTRKGSDGRIYGAFKDVRTGKEVWKSPQDITDVALAFPGGMRQPGRRVPVIKGGKISYADKRDVAYELPDFEYAFSPLGNLVPLKSMVKGQRVSMASRMTTQALPLVKSEAPLVQSAVPGTNGQRSFEDEYGSYMGAVRATQPGRVVASDPDKLTVQYDDGRTDKIELYRNHPYNRKSGITQTAMLTPGKRFDAGALLAKSNYTDDTGATALGLNARIAFTPWGGLNFEDAMVISESMAKKLSSEHMYQHQLETNDRTRTGLQAYVALFPGRYDKAKLANFEANGVIKVGTVVNYDDPLVLGAEERSRVQSKLHKKRQPGFTDVSVTWDHSDPGVVTDVAETKNGPVVLVKSVHPMQIADKLSNRYGGKGVVSAIIPDSQMPHDKEGQPYEMLLNPLGVISRTNPAQVVETLLGKLAHKLGKPIKVEDFDTNIPDRSAWAADLLKQHGVDDTEDIIDPSTGNKIPGVLTGYQFMMKLHHTAESKGQGRGGGGYASDETPTKGGESGSKRMALLDTNALLSHGATEVLRDAHAIRGQRNDDYWLQFMQGNTPRAPRVPMVYEKFVNELKASGINVVRDGSNMNIMAMTNKDVDKLAGDRDLRNGETVNFGSELEPIDGGLFDKGLTGGHHGGQWSAIRLHEPMPNPVMEEPIRRLLGLTQKRFDAVIEGKEDLNNIKGPGAIAAALKAINVDRDLLVARAQINGTNKSSRDAAVRRLGYLKAAKRLNIHPSEWMLDRVPVLPPQFRPVSLMGGKNIPLVADANFLYRELIEANHNLKEMKAQVGDEVGTERLATYNAFKAVTGLGDPITQKSQEKEIKGLLSHIFGSAPKFGVVQRKLLSSTVDNVGRAVITPNPDLDMDSVGLPEDRAFDVYSRFIVRRLRRSGMPMLQAMQNVRERTPLARKTLTDEMQVRPVIINRAPVLHRYGILAFRPRLTTGSAVQISPLVVKGFNADFDGDAIQYHVPADEEARKEALDRMLPSRQLLSPADFKSPVHVPGQEYVGGLFHATDRGSVSTRPVRTFRSSSDVAKAWRAGEIGINDRVNVLG